MGQPRDVEALIADVRRPRGTAKLLAASQGSEGRYGVSSPSSRTSRTIAKAHRTPAAGDENDAKNPSPAVSTSCPPCRFSCRRTSAWWRAWSERHRRSPSSTATSLEPTMSVNNRVVSPRLSCGRSTITGVCARRGVALNRDRSSHGLDRKGGGESGLGREGRSTIYSFRARRSCVCGAGWGGPSGVGISWTGLSAGRVSDSSPDRSHPIDGCGFSAQSGWFIVPSGRGA
jgi:hypothetical protein